MVKTKNHFSLNNISFSTFDTIAEAVAIEYVRKGNNLPFPDLTAVMTKEANNILTDLMLSGRKDYVNFPPITVTAHLTHRSEILFEVDDERTRAMGADLCVVFCPDDSLHLPIFKINKG